MTYKDLLDLAQKHYDSIQDAPDVEPAIMMAGFAQECIRAERERLLSDITHMAKMTKNDAFNFGVLVKQWAVQEFKDELREAK
jgi:hypothetical protein